MPDTKVAVLSAISTIDTTLDAIPIVDVSDTTMAVSGTTKRISVSQILAAGTNVVVPAGTAAAPSISFSGDSNTGIYAPAADQLSISSGGSGNATVSSTGLSVTGLVSATSTITGTQLISTLATGTAPLSINSTTLVSNLNADLLDGQHGTYYQDASNITAGTLAVTRGGTGILSYAIGDLIYASAATTLAKLASVASGSVLVSGGVATAPSWGKVELDLHVSKILPIANGGTGASTFTAGRVLFGNGTSALNTSANLFWDNSNNFLGINISTPIANLDVRASNGVGAVFLRTTDPSAAVASAYIQTPVSTGHSATSVYGFWYQNTGVANPSAETLAINTNATERLRIASDGVCTWSNVVNAGTAMTLNGTGLGVGVSPSHKLHVVGTAANLVRFQSTAASGPYVLFENASAIFGDIGSQLAISGTGSASNMFINARSTGSLMLATGDTARLTVDSSGNVGIGIAPSYKLDVAAAGAILANAPFSVARITGANAVANDLTLSGPNTSQVRLNFGDPENSGVGEIGYNHASNLMRFVVNNGQVHTLEPSGVFTWYDGAGGTRMTLNGTGLGVGVVPNAQAKLDVAGNVWLSPTAAYSTAPSAYLGVNVYTNTGVQTWAGRIVAGKANATAGDVNGYLAFQTNSSTDGIAERLRIDSSGNVGINTATPGGKLEVFLTSTSDPSIRLRYNSTSVYANHLMNGGGDYVVESPAANGVTSGNMRLRAGATFSIATNNSAATSPQLSLDTAGNLGLGVTPAHRLNVVRTGDGITAGISGGTYGIRFDNGGTFSSGMSTIHGVDSTLTGSYQPIMVNGSDVRFGIAGNLKMLLDSSGNLGLGVTPSAWQANWKVLQFANGSSIGNPFNGEGTFVGSNVYRNSSGDYIRLDTGYAAMYMQLSGSHRWHVAGTSNAGSTIPSFSPGSQAMTLDASGRLMVGTASARSNFFNSSVTTQLQVEGDGAASFVRNVNDVYGGVLVLGKIRGTSIVQNNDRVSQISFQGSDGTEFVECANISAEIDGAPGANDMPGRLVFSTTSDGAAAPTERLRITSAGVSEFSGNISMGTGYQVLLTDGAASAPGAAFTADTNTGIYRPAADTVAVVTGGVERAKVDSSGNVVVNTAGVATNATSGFLWIPSCAGTPTGSPTAPYTNAVALVWDRTNNKLYVYDGGWVEALPPA